MKILQDKLYVRDINGRKRVFAVSSFSGYATGLNSSSIYFEHKYNPVELKLANPMFREVLHFVDAYNNHKNKDKNKVYLWKHNKLVWKPISISKSLNVRDTRG